MTWREFKERVEHVGVQDEDEIEDISVFNDSELIVQRDPYYDTYRNEHAPWSIWQAEEGD